jgi:hypothetical protein
MEALSLIPFHLEDIEDDVVSKSWRERLLLAIRYVAEFFQRVGETSIEGTVLPIVLTLLTFLLLITSVYLTRWEHAAAGP